MNKAYWIKSPLKIYLPGRVLMLFFSLLCAQVLSPLASWGIERGAEELAGEHDELETPVAAPITQEPAREKAGADQNRPTLKLPDVVVKGDRQYRVTAERRDLLLMDPMQGTKGAPTDLEKVAVPGLDNEKVAPGADTITAKNYILTLEAAGGSSRQGEGLLIAGYEMNSANAILRADYTGGEHPLAHGIQPYDQLGNVDLSLGLNAIPATRLSLDLIGKGQSAQQPPNRSLSWGDWLQRAYKKADLRGEIELAAHSSLNLAGFLGTFEQNGLGGVDHPTWSSDVGSFSAEFEQDIQGLAFTDMNVSVKAKLTTQDTKFESLSAVWQQPETLKSLEAHIKFRPATVLRFDVGVKTDDYIGAEDAAASAIVGQASLLLPTDSTIYASADGGLDWQLLPDWSFDQPRPAIFGLPQPEQIQQAYRVGWRQRFNEKVSAHLFWFHRESENVPAWVDGDRDGLFNLITLPEGTLDGIQAELEVRYSAQLSQTFKYIERDSFSGSGFHFPNIPAQEGITELQLETPKFTVWARYHYLGERFGDVAEKSPGLSAAHLLGLGCDVPLLSYLNVFARVDNVLNVRWDEWLGYPGRGISALAGARIYF